MLLTIVAAFASAGALACGDGSEPATTTTSTPGTPTTETPSVTTSTAAPTTAVPTTTEAPATTVAPTTSPATTSPATTVPEPAWIEPVVWYLRGETLSPVRQAVPATFTEGAFDERPEPDRSIATALTAWLTGPTEAQLADGLTSAVPLGTSLRDVLVEGDVVTVDLSAEFESGGGSASMFARLAQLVMTVTTATPVPDPPVLPDGTGTPPLGGVGPDVLLRLDGVPVTTFSSEGIELDRPLTVDDANDWLPIIVADSVLPGDEVTEPLTVTGWANVFEAVVSFEVLDGTGAVLDEGITMATCGTGCRGWFSIPVDLAGHLGDATVVLYEVSSMDGSRVNVVELPVTVVPDAG
jgi:hypothetical protein